MASVFVCSINVGVDFHLVSGDEDLLTDSIRGVSLRYMLRDTYGLFSID